MSSDKKEKSSRTVHLKNTAEKLEINDYFNDQIKILSKKKKITDRALYKLREKLHIKGLPKMSDYWDPFLKIKIRYPKFKLAKYLAGATTISIIRNEKTEEVHCSIDEYPETNQEDVKRAHSLINKFYHGKEKSQAYPNLEVARLINELKEIGYSYKDIAEMIGGPSYSYPNIGKIRRQYLERRNRGKQV